MDPSRVQAVKDAIRTNFNDSPDSYDEFEAHTGLFAFLAESLAREASVRSGMSVLDVGCGTGISTLALSGAVGPKGKLTGLDLSPGMLAAARRRVPGAEFIAGDAEHLQEAAGAAGPYDAVLYNACIFLLPDAGRSLKAARAVLKDGGVAGMNFIAGSYADSMELRFHVSITPIMDGRELFTELLPAWTGGASPAPRFPCDVSGLETLLEEAGFRDIRRGVVERKMGLDDLRRFYAVPAQSASLFPRLPYEERRIGVERMFQQAEEKGISRFSMRWGWLAGRSSRLHDRLR